MASYVNASTQTKWAGLTQNPTMQPSNLMYSPPLDTPTPPDDNNMLATPKPQFRVPTIAHHPHTPDEQLSPTSTTQQASQTTTLLERRRNLLGIDARIELPPPPAAEHELNDEVPYSPPTTHALLSPVPEANRRHAGHTPLIPRAMSPEFEKAAEELEGDKGLSGALTLPSNPTDGANDGDHIGLDALDKVLGRIERQQKALRRDFDDEAKEGNVAERIDSVDVAEKEQDLSLSRKASADSRRSSKAEEVDGVRLKVPSSNFGAPLGQL